MRNKSEYGCVFAKVISLVLVYSAESSNLEVPQNSFSFTSPCSPLSGRHHAANILLLTQNGEAGGAC